MLFKKLHSVGREVFTFSPINLQISGGRDAAAAILDARDGLTTSSCALQDPLESLSLSDCFDGPARRRFAGVLGRGWSAAPGGPSSALDAEAKEFLIKASMAITADRFRMFSDAGVLDLNKLHRTCRRLRAVPGISPRKTGGAKMLGD